MAKTRTPQTAVTPPSRNTTSTRRAGVLSPKTPATVAGHGTFVAVTPDGESAYFTDNAGHVLQYDVDRRGDVVAEDPATVPAGLQPYGIVVPPDGKSVYVSDIDGDSVSQYDIDPQRGTYHRRLRGPRPAGAAPEDIAVTPPS